MRLFDKVRQQKMLSFTLVLVTLCIGIIIGTLINPRAHAAKSQPIAPDATPLKVPDPVELGNEFTKLAKRLEPSVVYITAEYTPKASENPHRGGDEEGQGEEGQGDQGGLDLFRRFFRNGPFGNEAPQRGMRQEQSGTGFIVDKNGYIITNNHVVSRVNRIKVKLTGDPEDYRARVVGVDPETDLAVLKIDAKRPLQPVIIGNSDAIQVGDWAVAIGSPFNLEASVTAGIVSALSRDIGTAQLQRFIQTDAAINPGNSGGPLLNIRGEVVGVNTMIATQSGGYQGIGFALPINMVVRVYNDIIKDGKVTRGSIGISWQKHNPDLLRALGEHQGVMVEEVTKGGPAAKAGMKSEDIIVAMNGKPVKDGNDLVARVAETPVGTPVTFTVDRSGEKKELTVTVADRAEVFKGDSRIASIQPPEVVPPAAKSDATAKFGMKIKAITDAERENLQLGDKHGVQVVNVGPGSFAEDVGLMENDIILAINRQGVTSVDDIRRIQASLKPGDAVAFRVMRSVPAIRGNSSQWQSLFLSGSLPAE